MHTRIIILSILLVFNLQSFAYEPLFEAVKKLKSATQTSITVLYPKGSKANLEEISKLFEIKYGIRIDLVEGSLDEISAELILNQKLGLQQKIIDIAIPATFSLPDLVNSNVIIELDSFERSYAEHLDPTNSLYSGGDFYDGKRYGFQTDGDTYLMFFNRSFLENKNFQSEYKLKYSKQLSIPTTWEELDQQIKFFHRPKMGQFGGSLFRNKNYIGWEFLARLHAKGVLPFDKEFSPQIASSKAVDVLKRMLDLNEYMVKDVSKIGLFENFELYKKGNIYANIGWGGTQKALMADDSKVANSLAYALLPGGESGIDNSAYFNWGWSFVITKRSKLKQLSYLFIKFATSSKMSIKSVSNPDGFFDPYQSAHYSSSEIQKIYTKSFLDIHKKSLEKSIPDFYVASRAEYMNALNSALFSASNGQLSPEIALRAVDQAWKKITQKVGKEKQANRWKKILSRYPENYRKVLKL